MSTEQLQPKSLLVHLGRPHGAGEPLNVPIVAASNFQKGGERGYSRNHGTPNTEAFESVIGRLEGGRAVAFASGMAAIAAVLDRLPTGSHVVLPSDAYHGSTKLAKRAESLGRLTVETLDVDDTGGWIEAAMRADLLWLESPSNPLLLVADLPTIARAPRKPGCLLAVDNTFATPLLQNPLELGADFVVHSATKMIGGHSDLIAGVLVARDDGLVEEAFEHRKLAGALPGALEMFLATRGLRSLALRLEAAQTNAGVLAERLENHDAVTTVRYPGLASHATHELAKRDLRGFGAMLSFDLATGAAADRFCERLRLIHHATSLGGIESTCERRGTYAGQDHLPPGLIRMSVGCEDLNDLWQDLNQSLR